MYDDEAIGPEDLVLYDDQILLTGSDKRFK